MPEPLINLPFPWAPAAVVPLQTAPREAFYKDDATADVGVYASAIFLAYLQCAYVFSVTFIDIKTRRIAHAAAF